MSKLLSVLLPLIASVPLFSAPLTNDELLRLYTKPTPFDSVPYERWIAESENAFAIRDKNPQAPVHFLVLPKKRVPTMMQASDALLGEMLGLARRVAAQEGIAREGFRLVINTHPQGGQHVYYLHIHVMGGRDMKWPPG